MRKMIPFLFMITFSVEGMSQTQGEMNAEQEKSYNNSDKKLNAVYQAILEEYKNDTIFLKALRVSQRNWIKFSIFISNFFNILNTITASSRHENKFFYRILF